MHLTRYVLRLLAGSLLALCLFAGSALASPVTVELRVEGSSKTLYEGPVTTEGESFSTPSSEGTHPCDYSENGPEGGEYENGGAVSGTPTSALRDGALAAGLEFNAKWYGTPEKEGNPNGNPGDYFVTQVGPDIDQDSGEYASWGYAVNNTTAPVGGCQVALAPGSEVLWAYNYFNLEHRLVLAAPSTADLGAPITVHVTDGQTGAPLAGMSIGEMAGGVTTTIPGGPVTNAAGEARIVLSHTGTIELKAQGPKSVRSNGIAVCVHNGDDGTCQTTIPTTGGPSSLPGLAPVAADVAKVTGIASGRVFSRRAAPRILRGAVTVPSGGTLRDVRISLQRRFGDHCWYFSGTLERFVRGRCSTRGSFSVGDSLSFSYLLPSRLPAGRYVYDIQAVSATGGQSALKDGTSHVVFRVR